MLQNLLAGLLVISCAAYVAWALLLPAAVRRQLVQALLRQRLPGFVERRLQSAVRAPLGCACDGCDAGTATGKRPAAQPVHWVPRSRH
jgi:hypothetical protein